MYLNILEDSVLGHSPDIPSAGLESSILKSDEKN